MHTMKFGPRILITNNKKQETTMKKLETYDMPPVIMGIENETESAVAAWYKNHQQVRNVVLEFAKRHPTGKVARLARSLDLNSYPETYPAPPCILAEEGEE